MSTDLLGRDRSWLVIGGDIRVQLDVRTRMNLFFADLLCEAGECPLDQGGVRSDMLPFCTLNGSGCAQDDLGECWILYAEHIVWGGGRDGR